MTYSQVYLFHRYFFIAMAFFAILLLPFRMTAFKVAEYPVALLLFFGLGIPHGALDFALGRRLYKPAFGNSWWLFFLLSYLGCVLAVVYLWLLFPLMSFSFFLVISALHFGLSDTLKNKGFEYILEGILRGFLPIAAPAYFYPEKFRIIVENVLTNPEASLVAEVAQLLFYPILGILTFLIVANLLKSKKEIANILEIISVILLFFFLTPFRAFLIYFCFLHSLRHILSVLEEMKLCLNWHAVKWVILQALPSTLATLVVLSGFYIALRQGVIDLHLVFNLFFISLAALTVPHMLLVEFFKREN